MEEETIISLDHNQNQVFLKRTLYVVFWSILFTLAYAQSPLFSSNQNQYFLHGLANAGFGQLSEDWLANTLDPTPVFSKLIEISWRALPWQPIFYIYFGILEIVLLLICVLEPLLMTLVVVVKE